MQRKIVLMSLLAASVIAGTASASAQVYDRYGNYIGPQQVDPRYQPIPVSPMYYGGPGAWYNSYNFYGGYNGANHPTPGSTQGDVGPRGNNNGTLTGIYRGW